MNVIEVVGLRKSYGSKEVLHGIEFCVAAGQIMGFLGPNGAGKTTTIRIVLGLIRASSGETRIFGASTRRGNRVERRNIGYLPGELRLYPSLSGLATLDFLARARRVDCRREIERLASIFDLDLQVKVRSYSSGMKQKLGLIQALMHKPSLVILDEPTTGLDPLVRQSLFDELLRVVGEGRTILFSSHVLSEVSDLCDQVVMVRGGHIVENQSIRQLRLQAMRRVEVIYHDIHNVPSEFPAPLKVLDRRGNALLFTWSGGVDSLLGWLAGQSIQDVAIGKPSLEELFLGYYRDEHSRQAS